MESEPALSGAGVEAALELDDNCVKRNVRRAIQDKSGLESEKKIPDSLCRLEQPNSAVKRF
jgi:hypothetical protein